MSKKGGRAHLKRGAGLQEEDPGVGVEHTKRGGLYCVATHNKRG